MMSILSRVGLLYFVGFLATFRHDAGTSSDFLELIRFFFPPRADSAARQKPSDLRENTSN